MRAYIIRRLLLIIPTLFILTIIVFLAVRFIPGDIVDFIVAMQEGYGGDEARIDRELVLRQLGLDVPVYVQYGRWIGVLPTPDWPTTRESHFKGLLQGSFGEALHGGWLIEERLIGRLPVTIQLGAMSIVIGLIIALPVGIYSAIRQNTATDYVGRTAAVIGLATPNFWLAIMVMLYPALWWAWSPLVALIPFKEDPPGESWHVPHSDRDSGDGHVCRHHAHDAHHDAGGLKAGLHQDGLGQGSQGEGRRSETHRQECAHPGSDARRSTVPPPDRGLRYLGADIRSARDRSYVRGSPRS